MHIRRPNPKLRPFSSEFSPSSGSRDRAALDIAVAALREARRDLIVAVRASCELKPEEFNPENANMVRNNIDRALDKIAGIIPEAAP